MLVTLFAAVALAAPADNPTKVVRNPTKVQHKRYYGEQFCDCVDDCMSLIPFFSLKNAKNLLTFIV